MSSAATMNGAPAARDGLALAAGGAPARASGHTPKEDGAASALRRLADALWYRRSVRAQLLLTVIVIDVIAALITGGVMVLKAKTSTRIEIAASMKLAEVLVREAVGLMPPDTPAEQFLAGLPLQQHFARHVRIAVRDAAERPVISRPMAAGAAAKNETRAPAPAWFAWLISSPVEQREVPITLQDRRIGSVLISGEPSDEIAEAWENLTALAGIAFLVSLATLGLLYVLFGRVLDPLVGLGAGLRDLERQSYGVRLQRPNAAELAAITDRFNALAGALEAARTENAALCRRLITAQDDERRHTAHELHDEVGPSLFGLKANATSISTLAATLPAPLAGAVRERADEILAIIDHLQAVNRSLLTRLRPMALGHVPLDQLLSEMVRERARQHPHIRFSFASETLEPGYGDSIDLTVYRSVQESLTNAIRHAQAARVRVDVAERIDESPSAVASPASRLEITVEDDGRGIDPRAPAGFGLQGMQERVRALGGECRVDGTSGHGTIVRIAIPIVRRREQPADRRRG
jgi:two-component system sensor histidine kinase UhpB